MEYNTQDLIAQALEAREHAYVPYSHFAVGAALLCADGTVYGGANLENAAHTPCTCAERTAFFRAVFDGHRDFCAIAIVGGPEGSAPESICPPCGVCRQVMMEWCDPATFTIILGGVEGEEPVVRTLEQILPYGFGPQNLAR